MTEIPAAVEAELARLRADNTRLLRLLKMTSKQAAPPGPAQAAFFDANPGMVDDGSSPDAKVAFFGALFAARTDVYAIRYDNARTGRGGWVPAVRGGWRKGMRHDDADFLPLTPEVFAAHLKGQVHIGLYPLLDGDRCWWLAAPRVRSTVCGPRSVPRSRACSGSVPSSSAPSAANAATADRSVQSGIGRENTAPMVAAS